jgi:hypothetical protein
MFQPARGEPQSTTRTPLAVISTNATGPPVGRRSWPVDRPSAPRRAAPATTATLRAPKSSVARTTTRIEGAHRRKCRCRTTCARWTRNGRPVDRAAVSRTALRPTASRSLNSALGTQHYRTGKTRGGGGPRWWAPGRGAKVQAPRIDDSTAGSVAAPPARWRAGRPPSLGSLAGAFVSAARQGP